MSVEVIDVMKISTYSQGCEGTTAMSTIRDTAAGRADGLVDAAVSIVSAYVTRNVILPSALPELIASVHSALSDLRAGSEKPEAEPAVPATSIRKSVTPSHLVCLEDGERFISLKRHLQMAHGMTADQYRRKWGLPADYPMVSPQYSAGRSALAKQHRLGQKGGSVRSKRQALAEPI